MKPVITQLVLWLALSASSSLYALDSFRETPSLLARVQSGELPPVEQRVPNDVQVVQMLPEQSSGEHGGQLRLLMGKQKDIRQMVIYGYARLVGYTPDLELKPDILKRIDIVEGRTFTLHLRKGHKWSDGHPFTSEDFRYYWEDIANNPQLAKSGPPILLMVDGKPPQVDYLDAHTVRYSWDSPNPYFLTALAGASPLYIYKPAHYLRQFHPRYQKAEVIEQMIADQNKRNWMGIHVNRDRPYKATNPDLPTLQPWMNVTSPPSQRFIFERNPYYHRVDQDGRDASYPTSTRLRSESLQAGWFQPRPGPVNPICRPAICAWITTLFSRLPPSATISMCAFGRRQRARI